MIPFTDAVQAGLRQIWKPRPDAKERVVLLHRSLVATAAEQIDILVDDNRAGIWAGRIGRRVEHCPGGGRHVEGLDQDVAEEVDLCAHEAAGVLVVIER